MKNGTRHGVSDVYKSDTKSENRFKRDQIEKESGGTLGEEYAAEITYPQRVNGSAAADVKPAEEAAKTERNPVYRSESYRWLGYTALLLSVLSLFVYPALFGTTAALFGFFAYMLGFRALGAWSVIIGLISLAGYFILVPLYA